MQGARNTPLLRLALAAVLTGFLVWPAQAAETLGGASEGSALEPFSDASVQFDFARGLFARKLYEEAAAEYAVFLKKHPDDPRTPEALARLGEAYFEIGDFARAEKTFELFLRRYPGHEAAPAARLRMGCARIERQEFDQAIEALRPLTGTDAPEAVRHAAWYYLGRSLQDSGKLAEAREALQKALSAESELEALALYALGEVELALGAHQQAAGRLQAFLQKHPDHRLADPATLRLAEALRAQGKIDEAARSYRTVVDRHPDSREARKAQAGLGWIALAREDYEQAEKTARSALDGAPADIAPALRRLLGVALLRQKKYEAAEAQLAQITNGPEAPAALRDRTWALLGAGRIDDASNCARAYLSRYPDREPGTAHYLLGVITFRKAEYHTAARHFEQAREDPATPHRAEAAYQAALAHERTGDHAQAEAAYAEFVQAFPDHKLVPAALLGMGAAQTRQEEYEAAVETYRRVLDNESSTPAQREEAWSHQAVAHYELADYEAMDECYRSLLEAFPHSAAAPEARYWVGWGAQHRRHYPEAIKQYQQFLETYPNHALADKVRYRLGMSQYQAGHADRAAEVFYGILTEHPKIEIGQDELLWLGTHYMRRDAFDKAVTVYRALLERHPGPKVRTMTLFYLAEILREQKDWDAAIENYRLLASDKDARYRSMAHFGLAVCLRETGHLDEARAAMDEVELSPDDPLRAALELERGLLAKAQGRTDVALRRFLRVGLLYDDLEVCGRALYEAGRLAEAQEDYDKARTCYEELTGATPHSYGAKYAEQSPWSRKAEERLQALSATQQAPSEEQPSAPESTGG